MKKSLKSRILEHLWGPTGSVLLHILVIFLAINFISFAVREEAPEIEVMMMEPEAVDIEELEELQQEIEEVELPDVKVDVSVETDVPTPDEMTEFASDTPDVDFAALDVMDSVQSPLVMKGLFSGRSAAGRASSLRQFGGRWGQVSERAVRRALEWLKEQQLEDGSWPKNKIPMTGLALLTFLAHGETPGSAEYGDTVEKGIRFLVRSQVPTGQFGTAKGNYQPYVHAIATYAISEAYGLTRIPKLRRTMESGIAFMIEGQQEGGGFDYGYKKGDRRDTSVSGWHVQAMKAAYLAGAETPGLKQAMAKSIEDILEVYNPEVGSFGYTDIQGRNIPMTAVGALTLQFLGEGDSQEAEKAMDMLRGVRCEWEASTPGGIYGWYYITQAKFHHGGGDWRAWNNEFARTLTSTQKEEGYWEFPRFKNGNHEHGDQNGYVYSTTLAALMLQVYYRHLPTFMEGATEGSEDDAGVEEDIVIEII